MFFSRRHVFLNGGGKTILVKNLADPNGANPFTLSTGFTTGAGKVLTLFLDFTCTEAVNLANLLCAGLAPQNWDYLGFRWYMSAEEQMLYMGRAQQTAATASVLRRNKAVIRLRYTSATSGAADVWMNGQQLCAGLAGDCGAGTVTISNAEGNNRFRGTYHEVSLLPAALRDEQLRALTA